MDYKELIIASGKQLLTEGFTVDTWGNISAFDRSQGRFYISPSGMDYHSCSTDDVVVMGLDGRILEGHRKPSIEWEMHRNIYLARPDVGAVVHTHPVASAVFACTRMEIPLLLDEAAQTLIRPVKTADYALPGSSELATNCVLALGDGNACLLASHGAVCVGADMKKAFKVAKVLETAAEIYFRILAIGKAPAEITPENLEQLRLRSKFYGQPSAQ